MWDESLCSGGEAGWLHLAFSSKRGPSICILVGKLVRLNASVVGFWGEMWSTMREVDQPCEH